MSDTVQVIVEQQTDNVLVRVAQVIGPQGPTGPPGADGTVTVSDTAPSPATAGQLWYNPDTHILSIWSGDSWVVASGSSVTVQPDQPYGNEGDLWYNPTTGILSVYVADNGWVLAGGRTGHIYADAPPATANEGDQWEDTTDGTISYWDSTNGTWVQASHPEPGLPELAYYPDPQQLIIQRASGTYDVYNGVVDISDYFKGNAQNEIPSLVNGDTVYFGAGEYEWQGHYCVPGSNEADWKLPHVWLICPIARGARIKLKQGKKTYDVISGALQRAMAPSIPFSYQSIPFFIQNYATPALRGTFFKNIIFDCNAEDNILNHAGLVNLTDPTTNPGNTWAYDSVAKRPIGFQCEYIFMYASGASHEVRNWVMEDCKIVGWTAGGTFIPGTSGAGQYNSYEQFVFVINSAIVRRCEFSEFYDLMLGSAETGWDPLSVHSTRLKTDTQYTTYGGIPTETIYCTVLHVDTSAGCLIEDCSIIGPEYLSGTDDTNWWRIQNQPWMVNGKQGYRHCSFFAYSLPVTYTILRPQTIFRNCRAERVTHAFHRDTLNMSPTRIENCIGYGCVKGVRNIVGEGYKCDGLEVINCEFHIIDALFNGLANTNNVDSGGSGSGLEAGVYLDARSSKTSGAAAAEITNTMISGCYFTTYKDVKSSSANSYRGKGRAIHLFISDRNTYSGSPVSITNFGTFGRIYAYTIKNNRVKETSGLTCARKIVEPTVASAPYAAAKHREFSPAYHARGSSVDAEDYLNLVLAEGNVNTNSSSPTFRASTVALTQAQENLINDFYLEEIASGTFGPSAPVKRMYYFGWGDTAANKIDMVTRKSASYSGTGAGLTAYAGYMTNPGLDYLIPDSGGTVSSIGASGSNMSMFALLHSAPSAHYMAMGLSVPSSNTYATISSDTIGPSVRFALPSVTDPARVNSSPDTTRTGVYVGSSTGTGNRFLVVQKPGGQNTITSTTTSTNVLPNVVPYIFARNVNGVGAASYQAGLGLAGYGTAMTQPAAEGFAARLKTFWEKMSGLTLP